MEGFHSLDVLNVMIHTVAEPQPCGGVPSMRLLPAASAPIVISPAALSPRLPQIDSVPFVMPRCSNRRSSIKDMPRWWRATAPPVMCRTPVILRLCLKLIAAACVLGVIPKSALVGRIILTRVSAIALSVTPRTRPQREPTTFSVPQLAEFV